MPSSRSLVFAPEAEDDVLAIMQFTLETWGDVQRRSYAATLDAALARLADFPGIGKERDDLAVGLHGYSLGEHIILYRVTDDSVIIRRVIHSRRDVAGVSDL